MDEPLVFDARRALPWPARFFLRRARSVAALAMDEQTAVLGYWLGTRPGPMPDGVVLIGNDNVPVTGEVALVVDLPGRWRRMAAYLLEGKCVALHRYESVVALRVPERDDPTGAWCRNVVPDRESGNGGCYKWPAPGHFLWRSRHFQRRHHVRVDGTPASD